MIDTIKKNWKRYLISSGLTFLVGLIAVLLANWGDITLDAFKDGSIIGVIFLALRGGFKLLLELSIGIIGGILQK